MSGVAEKARRQRIILDLLRNRPIGSQEELAQALARRGHAVAQPTLSRDLHALRVARVPTEGGFRYLPPGHEAAAGLGPRDLQAIATAEVLAVDANEIAVVVRTQVGRAQGVGVFLDGLRLPEVLATVAGDDTVLVLPSSIKKTRALRKQLRELFELT